LVGLFQTRGGTIQKRWEPEEDEEEVAGEEDAGEEEEAEEEE